MTSIDTLIERQLRRWEIEQRAAGEQHHKPRQQPPEIVTVSRQRGSRGSYFASRLARQLNFTRLHRDIIDAICTNSGYRRRVVEALDDRFQSRLTIMVDSLLTGQVVDHSDYRRNLFQVVLSMVHFGGIVVVGRGANLILGRDRGFHIRVIAPETRRIENLVKYCDLNAGEAEKEIVQSDRERAEFVRKVFNADIDNPACYDLVINTDRIDVEELVIGTSVLVQGKFSKQRYPEHDVI